MTRLDPIDARLRAAFDALRAAEERDAPSFDAVVALPPRTIATHPARRMTAALAVAAALLLAARVAYHAFGPPELVMPREILALSAWRSPTIALLSGATQPLITRAPSLGASLLDTQPGEQQ